jgi:hypothetical protein
MLDPRHRSEIASKIQAHARRLCRRDRLQPVIFTHSHFCLLRSRVSFCFLLAPEALVEPQPVKAMPPHHATERSLPLPLAL